MNVRQHYNLATTGKLGQKLSGHSAPKSGKKSTSTTKKRMSGSHTKKYGY